MVISLNEIICMKYVRMRMYGGEIDIAARQSDEIVLQTHDMSSEEMPPCNR